MTDNVAVLDGYTEMYVAAAADYELYLLCKPDADFDATFKAWDTDQQEFITVNGWLFTFEFIPDTPA